MRVLGVILSGGKSRRMGTDKANLPAGDRTWLERARTVLHEAGIEAICVSGRPDLSDGIADKFSDAGPVGGIMSVLITAQTFDAYVVVPVDMPHITGAHISPLVDAIGSGAAAARYTSSPLPLALRTDALTAVKDDLIPVLKGGNTWAVKDLLSRLKAVSLPDPADDVLANINTPEELSQLDRPACAIIRVRRAAKPDKPEAADYLKGRLKEAGFGRCFDLTADEDIKDIRRNLSWAKDKGARAIITLGGTGPGPFDVTPEAIEPMLDKRFDGFSVLFHMHSHKSAGLSAMLSRAFAGTIGDTLVFGLPSSLGAVTDAWENILHYHLSPDPTACSLRRVVIPKGPRP